MTKTTTTATLWNKNQDLQISVKNQQQFYVAGKTRVTELLFYNSRTDTEVNIKFVPRSDCYCGSVKRIRLRLFRGDKYITVLARGCMVGNFVWNAGNYSCFVFIVTDITSTTARESDTYF